MDAIKTIVKRWLHLEGLYFQGSGIAFIGIGFIFIGVTKLSLLMQHLAQEDEFMIIIDYKMKKTRNSSTLEEGILVLQRRSADGPISVGEILQTLSGKGQFLTLLFLSLPFCQPLQIPGLSTLVGLVIAFIGLRVAFGKNIWLPRSFLEKKIKSQTVQKVTGKILWLVKKMKRWVHPRLAWLCAYPASHIINGLLIAILGLFLALPLPIPFSNLTAAWSIFFIGLGILECDGVFVLIGYLISLIAFVFFIAMFLSIKLIF